MKLKNKIKKRKRYFGDLEDTNFSMPTRAKNSFNMDVKRINRQRKIIQILRQSNRRMREQLTNLKKKLIGLKKICLTFSETDNVLRGQSDAFAQIIKKRLQGENTKFIPNRNRTNLKYESTSSLYLPDTTVQTPILNVTTIPEKSDIITALKETKRPLNIQHNVSLNQMAKEEKCLELFKKGFSEEVANYLKYLNIQKGNLNYRIQEAIVTDVDKVNIKSTCRICLIENTQENLFCLFESNRIFENLTIATVIADCFGVDIAEDATLSGNVCIECTSSTLQSYMFKKFFIDNQDSLEKNRAIHQMSNQIQEETDGVMNTVSSIELTSEANDIFVENVDANIIHDSIETVNKKKVFEDHSYCKQSKYSIGKIKTETAVIQNINDSGGNESKDNMQQEISSTEANAKSKITYNKNTSNSKKWWSKSLGPPYKCKICSKNFGVRYKSFYTHVWLHKLAKIDCRFCGKKFTRPRLSLHLRSHAKEKPYHCNYCLSGFTTKSNLKMHLVLHTGEKKYICDVCGKAFSYFSSLKCHKQRHIGEARHVCNYCGKTFTADDSYAAHVYQNHNKVKSYPCAVCGRSFSKPSILRIHERTHSSNRNYYCNICNKTFRSNVNYSMHQSWHEAQLLESINVPVICKFCNEEFMHKNELIVHILNHIKKPYLCTTCNKCCSTRRLLRLHSCFPLDKMPFHCDICNKKFKVVGTYKQHVKTHLGNITYKCDVCNRQFVHQQNLTRHMLTHSGVKRHICTDCGKAFALNCKLIAHKRRHTGETPYICDSCGKGFYSLKGRKRHRDMHIEAEY